MQPSWSTEQRAAMLELAALYLRRGCVRRCDLARRAAFGHQHYKKGDEVRLVAASAAEAAHILQQLNAAGFTAGRPFRRDAKSARLAVPLYGRDQVERFLDAMTACWEHRGDRPAAST